MILIYDVNDGIWESKGNFQMAKEDNDDITLQPTNDGKFNLDVLCVCLLIISYNLIMLINFLVFLQCFCCPSAHTFTSSNFYSH